MTLEKEQDAVDAAAADEGAESPLGRKFKVGIVAALLLPFALVAIILIWSEFGGFGVNASFGRVSINPELGADIQLERVQLTELDGEQITLASLADGNWLLVDFWASWCAPCRQEAPALAQAYDKWNTVRDDDDKVEFIGVAVETDPAPVQRFVDAEDVPFPIALYDGVVTADFGVVALPEKFFISPDGEVQDLKLIGPTTFEQLDAILNELTTQG